MHSALWISHTNFTTSFSFYVTSGKPLHKVCWCTFRESFLALRMPSPQLSMFVVRTSVSTKEWERDIPTMSGAVLYSRETALCSWKWAPYYTTAAQRLQRQRLCQQTQHFKALATIVGSNREERSCLWVPKANWSLRSKNRIQKNLAQKQWEKSCSFMWNKSLSPQETL